MGANRDHPGLQPAGLDESTFPRAPADDSRVGTIAIDARTQIVGASAAAMWVLGVRRDELIGRRLCAEVTGCACAFHAAAGPGVPHRVELPDYLGGAGPRPIEATVWPIPGANPQASSPVALLVLASGDAVSRLVPDRQAQPEIGALISHELRGPLASLRAASELALSPDVAAGERGQLLEVVARQVTRLDRLTRTLIEAFRLSAGALELHLRAVELAAVCRDVIADMDEVGDGEIELVCAPNLPTIFADEEKVRTVLSNLVGNAIKHSPKGTRILLEIGPAVDGLRVAVHDGGPGIAAEHLPSIFDRFYQVASRPQRAAGFGLGLYIVKMLIESHGGRVWAESRSDGGSSFIFTLPVTPDTCSADAASVRRPALSIVDGDPPGPDASARQSR